MSSYPIASIPLAPISGVHSGTGTHQSRNWVVVPASVPGTANLEFTGADVQVTTLLYQLGAAVVPNWFGVALPHGIQDFTRLNIFFHPLPAQAGYKDADYPTKSGLWPHLFYYMEVLGYQMDGAARNQIVIMPFLTEAATDTGIFLANWLDIATDILTDVRSKMSMDDGSALQIAQVVVSSFSVGIVYSSNFRQKAVNLDSYLAEVWDFDGLYSSSSNLSKQLQSTAQYQAIKYDQIPAAGPASYHVPLPRWANLVVPPTTSDEVHGYVRDFMFLHAATVSSVGEDISAGVGSAAGSGSGIPEGSGTGGAPPFTPGFPPPAPLPPVPAPAPFVAPIPPSQPTPTVPLAPAPPAPLTPVAGPSPGMAGPTGGLPAPTAGGGVVPSPGPMGGLPVPSAGGDVPSVPASGGAPTPQPGPHSAGSGCQACPALLALVSNVAATAATGITAITAIASEARKEGRGRRLIP